MAKADQPSKKRTLKKTETVRERATKASQPRKPRRVSRARNTAIRPARGLFRLVRKGLLPFRFLLRPFKTRIGRFLGRILSRLLLFSYFRESWQELRKVTWPDRKQTTQLTLAVFAFAFFFAAIVGFADLVLDKIFKALILN